MKQIKKLLNDMKLSKDSKDTFELDVLRNNLAIGTVLLFFSFAFQLFNLFYLFTHRFDRIWLFPRRHYFFLYVSLAVISLIYLIIIYFCKKDIKKYNRLFKIMLCFFVCFIALWGNYITLLDLRASENVRVYVMIVITIAVTMYQKPWQTTIILICNHILFCAFFSVYQRVETNNAGNLINTTAIVIIAVIIVYYRYYALIMGYKKNQYIIKQNKAIRARNEELKKLAVTDALSGLYNRRLLDKALIERREQCLVEQQVLSVAMFDIDNFKSINDQLGHQIGDQCIIQVASVIRECTEDLSAMSFRYGGEEFTVIFYQMDVQQVLETCEIIREKMHDIKFVVADKKRQHKVTISAGICSAIPIQGVDYQEYINIADKALRKAKLEGKDRVISFDMSDNTNGSA